MLQHAFQDYRNVIKPWTAKNSVQKKSPWDIRFQSKKHTTTPLQSFTGFEFYLKYQDCGHMNTSCYPWKNIRIPSMYVLFTYFCLIFMVNSQGKYTVRPIITLRIRFPPQVNPFRAGSKKPWPRAQGPTRAILRAVSILTHLSRSRYTRRRAYRK